MVTLVCKKCGKEFQAKLISTKFCSRACAGHARKGENRTPKHERSEIRHRGQDWSIRKLIHAERLDAVQRREKIRARDAAYAAWERENGVSERVVESEGVRTVIRGRVCVGRCAANSIKYT